MKLSYLFSLLILFLFTACKKQKTTQAIIKDVTEVVYASGTLVPVNSYKIYSQADGQIAKILVSEGEVVRKGQTILIIDNSSQEAKNDASKVMYENALYNYQNGSPFIQEAENILKNLKTKNKNDSVQFFRLKALFAQNIGTKNDLEKAEMAYSLSSNEINTQQQRILKLKLQLEQELKNAKAQYISTSKEANNCLLTSLINGKVYDITKKEGELVRRNDIIASVGQSNTSYVQLWIDEADLLKVKFDQKVLVKTDVDKNKIFFAKISKIYPSLNLDNHSIKVEAVFEKEEPILLANATVEANIIIQEKKNALLIPKKLVLKNDSVQISNNGKIEKVKIKPGIETTEFVEVLEGIDTKTVLIAE